MTVYHVTTAGNDANDGLDATPAHAWLTITYAATVVVAGDTVNVHAGTYAETPIVYKSGTPGNIITFQNYGTDTVIIDGTGLNPANSGIIAIVAYWNSVNYVTVKGFTLQNGTHDANEAGVHINSAGAFTMSYITLQNLNIINTGTSGILAGSTGYALPVTITNLTIDTCTLYHTNNFANQEGLTLVAVDTFEIKNCLIHTPVDTYRLGICAKTGCKNGLIHNNTIYGFGSAGITVGDYDGTCNVKIYGNICHDNGEAGISVADTVGVAPTITGIYIYHNKCYRNGNGIQVNRQLTGLFADIDIMNNFCYLNGAANTGNAEIFIEPPHTSLSDIVIRGNLLYAPYLDYTVHYADNGNDTGQVFIDHNNIKQNIYHGSNVLGTNYILNDKLIDLLIKQALRGLPPVLGTP